MELQEKIDQYVLDNLNKADKSKFEELIANDAVLKNEIGLQTSISAVLNTVGAAKLKANLNSIPVSMASTGNAIMYRWIGAGVAASLLTGLIIFLLPAQQEQKSESTQAITNQTTTSAVQNNTTVAQDIANQSNNTVVSTTNKTEDATKKDVKSTKTPSISSVDEYTESSDFSDVTNGDNSQAHKSLNMPSSNLTTENNKLSNLSVVIDITNKSEKSYQFNGSKLTLFGDFANHPYELLELNHKGQKTLFLSYQNDYYEMVWGKTTKSPLNKVTNKQTIEKLKLINN